MKLSDFDYHLPKELIAFYPKVPRDEARLMVIDRLRRTIKHRIFKDILDYLTLKDALVLNDTKVVKARLLGKKRVVVESMCCF
jgi:S-adenosylmethionine:tRNA ribosyltransferase-isomerase